MKCAVCGKEIKGEYLQARVDRKEMLCAQRNAQINMQRTYHTGGAGSSTGLVSQVIIRMWWAGIKAKFWN
ncbi:MAG: hypothetical protein A7315_03215 [Candidatus Altiarchaeales archaeon WOR_SM1_79]|nr:MAG: hypothetical protein A7315_03215 [Candidatus Altiarchaeales archaeon WOR_SM1_79]